MLTSRERFWRAFAFEELDRLPITMFGAWPETQARWRAEGLPDDWRATNYFGEDRSVATGVNLGWNAGSAFYPLFEEQTLEETETYVVFRNEHGRIVKRRKDEPNPLICEVLAFPVQSRADWEGIKERLDPDIQERYAPLDGAIAQHGQSNRDYPLVQEFVGTYRLLWHLFGDVQMAYVLHDDPDLVHEIMVHWVDFTTRALDRILDRLDVDVLTIKEDMCSKTGMMVSPRTFRTFMLPYYKQVMQHARRHSSVCGIWCDCDGNVEEYVPLLLEGGGNGIFPCEVQAGVDVVDLRSRYGERLVIRGGVDKRCVARGKQAIDRELERVLPTFVETGGYFFCLDHEAPPDISLEDYVYCIARAKELMGAKA